MDLLNDLRLYRDHLKYLRIFAIAKLIYNLKIISVALDSKIKLKNLVKLIIVNLKLIYTIILLFVMFN